MSILPDASMGYHSWIVTIKDDGTDEYIGPFLTVEEAWKWMETKGIKGAFVGTVPAHMPPGNSSNTTAPVLQ